MGPIQSNAARDGFGLTREHPAQQFPIEMFRLRDAREACHLTPASVPSIRIAKCSSPSCAITSLAAIGTLPASSLTAAGGAQRPAAPS